MSRCRIFKDSTELEYSGGFLELTGDVFADKAVMDFKPSSELTVNSILEFRREDGTTLFWQGKVEDRKRELMSEATIYGLGFELNNIPVQNVYEDESPEAIVQDVVDVRSETLSFNLTASSGVTISKYIAKAYAIDIIKDMIDITRWRLIVDQNGVVTFEPQSFNETGITYENGENCIVEDWNESKTGLVNRVRIIGGFESFATEETISGTDTTFTLSHKPSGTLKSIVGGSEVDPEEYEVDAENKKVTFNTTQSNPTFSYSYNRPVLVEDQDDDSVNEYGTIYEEVPAPWLTTTLDARRYAQKILEEHGSPKTQPKLRLPFLDFDRKPNQVVAVSDPVRFEDEQEFTIQKVRLDFTTGTTELELGERTTTILDWNRQVEDRIKKLERRFQNDDRLLIVRLYKERLNIKLETTYTWEQNSPEDSFIAGHHTLGRTRSSLMMEADCSDNEKHATWTGTGTEDGEQYTLEGYRLGAAQGNATDRVLTAPRPFDSNPSQASIAFFVWFPNYSSDQAIVTDAWHTTGPSFTYTQSTNTFTVVYMLDGTARSLTATNWSTKYAAETWIPIVLNLDASTGASLRAGPSLVLESSSTITGTSFNTTAGDALILSNGTSYASVRIDEYQVFETTLDADARSRMINRRLHDKEDPLYTSIKAWYSFDNPRAGDRSTPRTTI